MDGGSGRGTDPTHRALPWAVRSGGAPGNSTHPPPRAEHQEPSGRLHGPHPCLEHLLRCLRKAQHREDRGRRAQAGLPPGPVEKAGDPWEDARPIHALSTISAGPEVSCTAKPKEPLNLVQSSDIRGEINDTWGGACLRHGGSVGLGREQPGPSPSPRSSIPQNNLCGPRGEGRLGASLLRGHNLGQDTGRPWDWEGRAGVCGQPASR